MYTLTHINTITPKGRPIKEIMAAYIREKNLTFIVDQGKCANLSQADLSDQDLASRLNEFSACSFASISCPDLRPSPPFIAVRTEPESRTGQVVFLIDLTREAEAGRASKFYSKILGALSTQVFAHTQGLDRIFFPFELEETAGRGLALDHQNGGTFIRCI